MGNFISFPCFVSISISRRRPSTVKLVFSDGHASNLVGKHNKAGEIMFQFPHMIVCHADSFFIGHEVPSLGIDQELVPGETYFVLPVDLFASIDVLSTSSLASLGAKNAAAVRFSGPCPFEYVRRADGKVMVKVQPEFILRLVSPKVADDGGDKNLCSTPELKKHYDELVGSKGQVWFPKLETISECEISQSPCKFLGLKLKQKEKLK